MSYISQTLARRLIAAAVDLERARQAWGDEIARAARHRQQLSLMHASRLAHAARTALDLQETVGAPLIADPAHLRACMAAAIQHGPSQPLEAGHASPGMSGIEH